MCLKLIFLEVCLIIWCQGVLAIFVISWGSWSVSFFIESRTKLFLSSGMLSSSYDYWLDHVLVCLPDLSCKRKVRNAVKLIIEPNKFCLKEHSSRVKYPEEFLNCFLPHLIWYGPNGVTFSRKSALSYVSQMWSAPKLNNKTELLTLPQLLNDKLHTSCCSVIHINVKLTHFAYHVPKNGRKTSIIIISISRFSYLMMLVMLW